tara:strand:- start:2251 stop:3357 length:1107 start_codon:yes stop_codon:yes gene_type:complete
MIIYKNYLKKIYYQNFYIHYKKFIGNNISFNEYSSLFIKPDNHQWVISSISEEYKKIFYQLGINILKESEYYQLKKQAIFYLSKYDALFKLDKKKMHRIAFPYYHGFPDKHEAFKKCIEALKLNHDYYSRVQVTNSRIENLILETGINKNKVFKIPISIDLDIVDIFKDETKEKIRDKYDIPQNAFVIGSFQKDGDGWGNGNKPKLDKGPDILIKILSGLKKEIPELFVLLSGPSRGYVKNELSKLGIKFMHIYLDKYEEIFLLYKSIDLYLVTSRDEGGPRAILESMACKCPIISSKVGQAVDLIDNNINGWLVDVANIEEYIEKIKYVYCTNVESQLNKALLTAKENSYKGQMNMWKNFMKGFIEN